VGVDVYVPLLAALLLGAAGGRLSRALPPATAARALTGAAVVTAGATSFVLGVLAFTLLGRLPPVARLGRWSVTSLSALDPVPQGIAALACAAVVLLGTRGLRVGLRRCRATFAVRALCRSLGGEPGQLLVLDDDADQIFALPGIHGRIVASRSLLAALSAAERRAVLAHEAAHLRHHHHRYRTATELAVAVNPLLRTVADAVRFATERWADEEAARVIGDRVVVAQALATVGVRRHAARSPASRWRTVALEAADSGTVARVRALLAPPAPRRPVALVALAVLVAVTVSATVEAQRDAEHLFEQARPGPAAGAYAGSTPTT
jgi:Zn-dependent protease with chaperone function